MGYTAFDRFVAWRRFRAAHPHVRTQTRVCDLGCGLEARFLQYLGSRIRFGVGLDYQVAASDGKVSSVVLTDISQGLPVRNCQFDHVVMLAVLEHLAAPQKVLQEAFCILVPGGSLIMTWPNAAIDPILNALHRLGIVSHEMESEKHERRIPLDELVAMLRAIGFDEFHHRTFELGLNNLLVATKPRATPTPEQSGCLHGPWSGSKPDETR